MINFDHFLYICQMDSWPVLEMTFVMYQRYTYCKFIISATYQLDTIIFTFLGYLHAHKNKIWEFKVNFAHFLYLYVRRSPGLFWWWCLWFIKDIISGNKWSLITMRLIYLYSLFVGLYMLRKYRDENKRSSLLIFCICVSEGVLSCFGYDA